MVLDNNDEDWYDEAEEIDEAVDLDGTEFPLRLGKNLQGGPFPLSPHCTTMLLFWDPLGSQDNASAYGLVALFHSMQGLVSLCPATLHMWSS